MNNVYPEDATAPCRYAIANSRFQNGIVHGNNEKEFEIGFNDLALPHDRRFENMLFRTTRATSNVGLLPRPIHHLPQPEPWLRKMLRAATSA
jgi:hypothetical protein